VKNNVTIVNDQFADEIVTDRPQIQSFGYGYLHHHGMMQYRLTARTEYFCNDTASCSREFCNLQPQRVEPYTGSLLYVTTVGCHFCHPIYHITVDHSADHPRACRSSSTE
jgi:hypothetical protein